MNIPAGTKELVDYGLTASVAELNHVDGVTSAIQTQINAKAATSHTHSAADIASGTLPIARGGTGKSSLTANQVLYADGSGAIGQSSKLTYDGNTLTSTGTGNSGGIIIGPNSNNGVFIGPEGGITIRRNGSYQSGLYWHSSVMAMDINIQRSSANSSRIASGNDANCFTVDAGNDSVGVGIAIGSHAASAKLQVDSTTKGFLPPRMTSTQRALIASPAEGLVVHDTTLSRCMIFSGGTWKRIVTGDSYYDSYVTGPAAFYEDVMHYAIVDFSNGYALQAVGGCIELDAAEAYYLGDKSTDGTWRHIRSGNDLLFQRRESGSWVTKQTISA